MTHDDDNSGVHSELIRVFRFTSKETPAGHLHSQQPKRASHAEKTQRIIDFDFGSQADAAPL
jgi:hypothetical protein